MASAPVIPHLRSPFSLNPVTGQAQTVEQGSTAEVASCVVNILSCPKGAHPTNPDFGIDPILFQKVPINTAAILDAITEQEPRLRDLTADQSLDLVTNALRIVLSGEIASD